MQIPERATLSMYESPFELFYRLHTNFAKSFLILHFGFLNFLEQEMEWHYMSVSLSGYAEPRALASSANWACQSVAEAEASVSMPSV